MNKTKIGISSESTIDLQKDLLEKYKITTLPYTIIVKDQEFKDGEIDNQKLFDLVGKKGELPRTQAINEYNYEEYFTKLLETHEHVIHFCLSSKLSSSFNNAASAAAKLNNVFVIDTEALSTGIALLAINACNLRDQGKSAQEIYDSSLARRPYVQTSFILDKVDYLHKGGRCSLLTLIAANILGIKPQILMKEGKLEPAKKYRGKYDKAVLKYVNDTLEQFNTPDKSLVFITRTTATDELLDQVEAILKDHGFQSVCRTVAGCTISSHCGPNTLGILYINDGK